MLCSSNTGFAQGIFSDLGIEVSGDFNVSSLYMWRGVMLDGDAVIQPGFYLRSPESKLGRVKLGYWGSRDLENKDSLHSSETDFIFDYTYSFKYLDVSVGHTYYDFPDAAPADGAPRGWSREFYAGFTFPQVFLTPSVYFYYDYGSKEDGGGDGSYTVLNLAKSLPFKVESMEMSLDLSGHVGYNHRQYYAGDGGDVGLSAGVSVPITKNLSIKPNANYAIPWGNLSDDDKGNQKDRFYGGIYASYVF